MSGRGIARSFVAEIVDRWRPLSWRSRPAIALATCEDFCNVNGDCDSSGGGGDGVCTDRLAVTDIPITATRQVRPRNLPLRSEDSATVDRKPT